MKKLFALLCAMLLLVSCALAQESEAVENIRRCPTTCA